jgi:hypothetical protein
MPPIPATANLDNLPPPTLLIIEILYLSQYYTTVALINSSRFTILQPKYVKHDATICEQSHAQTLDP